MKTSQWSGQQQASNTYALELMNRHVPACVTCECTVVYRYLVSWRGKSGLLDDIA